MAGLFRFRFPIEVRFRDLDALGHVNNAAYLTYLESARLAYWQQATGRSGLPAFDMMLARAEIDYRAPISLGDPLEVGVRCASMRRSSFVLEFEVVHRTSGRLLAEARKVLVHYDHQAGRSKELPLDLRERILAQDPEATQES
ncbi:MAG TPA: thioesterase family protein [Vicinamibacteria bacterium]|nr:thioesterase family protein [Vicinamibacteria bacterium]